MKVSKGKTHPEIVAAAFPIVYVVLGSPFLYQVLIVTQVTVRLLAGSSKGRWSCWTLFAPPLGVEPSGTLFKQDPGGLGGTVLTSVLPILL